MAKEIRIWCEVVCDGCSDTMEGRFYRQGTIGRLRTQARKNGWKVLDGRTLCPRCAELYKTEKEKKNGNQI